MISILKCKETESLLKGKTSKKPPNFNGINFDCCVWSWTWQHACQPTEKINVCVLRGEATLTLQIKGNMENRVWNKCCDRMFSYTSWRNKWTQRGVGMNSDKCFCLIDWGNGVLDVTEWKWKEIDLRQAIGLMMSQTRREERPHLENSAWEWEQGVQLPTVFFLS